MLGSEPVLERAAADAAGPTEGPSARVSQALRDRPLTSIFIACLILGIISVLVLPWVPSSDPYAWISWGQEFASHIVGTKIALSYHGGPSFKPFPVIFTSIFGLFGGTGPGLWLVVSRTASLLALVGIFRLGKRFGGTPAGILAAVALCFTQDAVFYMARGTSEPVVAAVTVWAIDRHLDGAKRAAYFLLFLGALNRPEFTPILFLYGVWLWVTEPDTRTRAYTVGLLVLIPILWTFPPGIVNGDFLQAKNAAAGGKGSPGTAFAELKSSAGQLTDGILLLAAVGFGLTWLRRNRTPTDRSSRTLVWLGVAAIVWAVLVALITQFFYGLPRYLLPASVIACVFAALTVVWLAEMAASLVRAGPGSARTAVALAVGAAVVAVTLPWSIDRGKVMVTQVRQATASGTYQHDLFTAVDRLGGKSKILACPLSYVAINHTAASMLAWKLKADLFKVRPVMVSQGYVFVGPHVSDLGHPPPILSARVDNVRLVETSGAWRVYAVSRRATSKYGEAGSLCPGHV